MNFTLTPDALAGLSQRIETANQQFRQWYPGDATGRQPVHTVYGGAHLFKADTASKLGGIALRALDAYAAERHVELVPSLQSLGHMEHVLALERRRLRLERRRTSKRP